MNCTDARELVHAYADDELDLVTARQVDAHVRACPACGRVFESAQAIKTAVANPALYHAAPAALRQQLVASLPSIEGSSPPSPVRPPRWQLLSGIAAMLLLAIGAAWFVTQRTGQLDTNAEAILTAHVRSMQLPDHLMDVQSTDQHTVKPWFDGKLDFAPPVWQLADRGYPLIGGRLDYLQDRTVAALVYNRGRHVINLFIHPDPGGDTAPSATARQGYNIVRWRQGGMSFAAVSDVNPTDLQAFTNTFRAQH